MTTTTDLLDLRGIGQRAATFRFDLFDQSGAKLGSVSPDSSSPPTITNNTTSSVMRSLNGFNLSPADGKEFEEIGARIKPVMVLENGAEGPLGLFLFVSAQRLRNRYGIAFGGSMLDQGFILDQPTTETYGLDTGASIDGAVTQLFLDAGITGMQMDMTGAIVGSPIVWPPNTSRRQIVQELNAKSGRLPPYFDNTGTPQVRLTPDLATAPIVVTYADGLNIGDDITESNDLLNAPNRFKVVCTSASNLEITGQYDLPDSAPNSYYMTGVRISMVITEQGLADNAAAADRAHTAAVLDNQVYQHASYTGAPDFRHDTFQVHEFRNERWFEQSWSMVCKEGGDHGHVLQKVYS